MSEVLTAERLEEQTEQYTDWLEEEPEAELGVTGGDEEPEPAEDEDELLEDTQGTGDDEGVSEDDECGDEAEDRACPWENPEGGEGSGLPRSRDITTKELGRRGENAAANYLVRKGYRILERNWTCRFGECDIIAMDEEGTIVFVEVKTRRSSDCGLPEEAITKAKRRRYEKIALTFLMEADWDDDVDFRFDAIGIYVTGDFKAVLKHHIACFNGTC